MNMFWYNIYTSHSRCRILICGGTIQAYDFKGAKRLVTKDGRYGNPSNPNTIPKNPKIVIKFKESLTTNIKAYSHIELILFSCPFPSS